MGLWNCPAWVQNPALHIGLSDPGKFLTSLYLCGLSLRIVAQVMVHTLQGRSFTPHEMALVKHGQAGGLVPWVLPPVPGSISMENTCGVLPTAVGATHISSRGSWPGSGTEGLTVVGAAGPPHGFGSTDRAPI